MSNKETYLAALRSTPRDTPEPHPLAKEGDSRGFQTANDKKAGTYYNHYVAKDVLYFIPVKNVKVQS